MLVQSHFLFNYIESFALCHRMKYYVLYFAYALIQQYIKDHVVNLYFVSVAMFSSVFPQFCKDVPKERSKIIYCY